MSLLRLLRAQTRRSWVYSHPPSGLRVFSSKKITNKEIKESVDQVAAGWRAAADNSGVLKADPMSMDVQKLEEYQKIMEDLNAKQTELFDKCEFKH